MGVKDIKYSGESKDSSNKDNTVYKHYYALSLMGRINDAKWESIILTYLYWQA